MLARGVAPATPARTRRAERPTRRHEHGHGRTATRTDTTTADATTIRPSTPRRRSATATPRPPARPITWRSLFVLGLAGGLIPSTSALLILLGAIAAGRPGFGFVLVVAFGLGMAAVMGGIGLVLVLARERLERVPAGPALRPGREPRSRSSPRSSSSASGST